MMCRSRSLSAGVMSGLRGRKPETRSRDLVRRSAADVATIGSCPRRCNSSPRAIIGMDVAERPDSGEDDARDTRQLFATATDAGLSTSSPIR